MKSCNAAATSLRCSSSSVTGLRYGCEPPAASSKPSWCSSLVNNYVNAKRHIWMDVALRCYKWIDGRTYGSPGWVRYRAPLGSNTSHCKDYLAAAALARLPASTVASRRVRASGIAELWGRLVVKRIEIKASKMLVAPRISECFGLPWPALVCYCLLWSAIVCLGLL